MLNSGRVGEKDSLKRLNYKVATFSLLRSGSGLSSPDKRKLCMHNLSLMDWSFNTLSFECDVNLKEPGVDKAGSSFNLQFGCPLNMNFNIEWLLKTRPVFHRQQEIYGKDEIRSDTLHSSHKYEQALCAIFYAHYLNIKATC